MGYHLSCGTEPCCELGIPPLVSGGHCSFHFLDCIPVNHLHIHFVEPCFIVLAASGSVAACVFKQAPLGFCAPFLSVEP